MTVDDIYFVLFRHKWKIILCAILGILAAGGFLLLKPIPYQSEARLLIRFVLDDSGTLGNTANGQRMRSPDERGESIISSEVEILTSYDLAKTVAETIGPEKLLAKMGGGKDLTKAAIYVYKNLEVEAAKRGSVIHIMFKHPDPELVQPVLQEVIDSYIRKHIEIHQTGGAIDDFLTRKTVDLKNQLDATEKEIRAKSATIGVLSLEESKKSCVERAAKINLELLAAQSELAERNAALNGMTSSLTNAAAATNSATNVETAAAAPLAEPPNTAKESYKRAVERLDGLYKNYNQLRSQFTEESKLVKEARVEITAAEEDKNKLEQEYPRLLATAQSMAKSGTLSSVSTMPGIDTSMESMRIAGLKSKINFLTAQLATIQAEMTNLANIQPEMVELERKKQWASTNYQYFELKLEQSRINEALGNGKVSNISKVQLPAPPFKDGKKTTKIAAIIACGGIGFGLGLAFLLELFLDPSVKRSKDVETKLALRLFMTMPDVGRNGFRKSLPKNRQPHLLPKSTDDKPATDSSDEVKTTPKVAEIAPWEEDNTLRPFYDALRDRLVSDFENRNLNHKPKLVALTGCNPGAGVTTIAAGLAASLSKIGDGNVLLVDMIMEGGAAHQFYKGKPGCGLESALESGAKDTAMVQDNLYVVTGSAKKMNGQNGKNGENGSHSDGMIPRILPKQFAAMLPKMRASDFDYIIFDMPPVSQHSITPRLARFMDMNLLVVESEKTSAEAAKRAAAILSETKAEHSVILNKTHNYIPKMLNNDLA